MSELLVVYRVEWPSGCWVRPGRSSRPAVGGDRCRVMLHRFVYAAFVGPIPEGFDIHHRCGNPRCFHPRHLEALSRRDHKLAHRAETCRSGRHPKSAENVYVSPDGSHHCRACRRECMRRFRARRRGAVVRSA